MTTTNPHRRKRLIEVAFPLEEVSAHSRREKNVRHGHISTLHIWWARRPLAACRAFIYASLVDDPPTAAEREELLREVADLASWDAVRKPGDVVRTREQGGSGLTGRELLARARQRILDCNDGRPPRLLDPFAGGGAIPLEALRLGCEVEASDLNPVAVLILKGTVEYPQKYGRPLDEQLARFGRGELEATAGVGGDVPAYIREAAGSQQGSFVEGDLVEAYRRNPLATDVRYWGNWMLERARAELQDYYPPDPDGSVPVAYLWSRTVPCPSCKAEMPLIRQYWLARKEKKQVALEPVIDRAQNRVDFRVVEGAAVAGDPGEATTSRGDTVCLLCQQVVKAEYVRQAGKDGRLGAVMTSVVLQPSKGRSGKRYRVAGASDLEPYKAASVVLSCAPDIGELPAIPDEPIPYDPRKIDVELYGLDQWGKLFNDRQLLALTTFARLVREAHAAMEDAGLRAEYAKAVATYLGLAVDRLADYNSTVTRWGNEVEAVHNTLARQAIPMVWDFAEPVPAGRSTGSFDGMIDGVVRGLVVATLGARAADVARRDARERRSSPLRAVVTDPPYYDAINYADLSDFFYVWLKRSVGFLHPDLLGLPLTPKREQVVMNVYANGKGEDDRRGAARRHYVEGMAQAFGAMAASLEPGGTVSVVFAHTDPDAWGTLIEGLLDANLIPDASWPIDTELENKVSSLGQARLKTSVWMACRPRDVDAGEAFLDDVLREMQPVIRERLLDFWARGIRGADFFISAIGPALSVFGRHPRVLKPGGEEVSVREFLDIVRRESTHVALEQVLGGSTLGTLDPLTRLYVTWAWSFSKSPLDAGDAIALGLATGTNYDIVVRPGSIASEGREKSKKVVRLKTIADRGRNEEDLGLPVAGRAPALVDQLHRAAFLWSRNRGAELGDFRAELGETRWQALRVLGQAVADCLPDGDEDRRLINGLLGSAAGASTAPPRTGPRAGTQLTLGD